MKKIMILNSYKNPKSAKVQKMHTLCIFQDFERRNKKLLECDKNLYSGFLINARSENQGPKLVT